MRETREQRFDQLWQDHAPAVVRYARRHVLPDDVEDVVAEALGCTRGALKVRLHRARHRFAGLLGRSTADPRPVGREPTSCPLPNHPGGAA